GTTPRSRRLAQPAADPPLRAERDASTSTQPRPTPRRNRAAAPRGRRSVACARASLRVSPAALRRRDSFPPRSPRRDLSRHFRQGKIQGAQPTMPSYPPLVSFPAAVSDVTDELRLGEEPTTVSHTVLRSPTSPRR